jgi:hypothetical protein
MAPAVIFLSWRQCTVVRPSLQKLFVWWPLSNSLQLRPATGEHCRNEHVKRAILGPHHGWFLLGVRHDRGGDGVGVSFSIRVPWGNRVAPWMTLA